VEVHQSSATSTDVELAVELVANIAGFGPGAPRLDFARNANGTITLTWNAPGFCLQQPARSEVPTPLGQTRP
jgi:hypothetical protein